MIFNFHNFSEEHRKEFEFERIWDSLFEFLSKYNWLLSE